MYLDGDDIHSGVETAVLSHGLLVLCDHHYILHTRQVVMVPYCCRVHTPAHTHTKLIHIYKMLADRLPVKALNLDVLYLLTTCNWYNIKNADIIYSSLYCLVYAINSFHDSRLHLHPFVFESKLKKVWAHRDV